MTIAGTRFWVLFVLIVAGIVAVTATTVTTHRVAAGGAPTTPLVFHLHEVDTSVVSVDNPPKGTSAGDLLMFTATISSGGKPFGRYVGNCAYVTKTEIFCSIDMHVFGQGRIEFAGELSTQAADAVFPVTGGSGPYALARGYLTNHQTATGTSADQVLYLYWI
jgi:hypothetical protein